MSGSKFFLLGREHLEGLGRDGTNDLPVLFHTWGRELGAEEKGWYPTVRHKGKVLKLDDPENLWMDQPAGRPLRPEKYVLLDEFSDGVGVPIVELQEVWPRLSRGIIRAPALPPEPEGKDNAFMTQDVASELWIRLKVAMHPCVKDVLSNRDTEESKSSALIENSLVASDQSNKLPVSVRYAVIERDRGECQACGRTPPDVVLHVDHVVPRSKGGADSMDNLQVLCDDCNQGKGNRFTTDWRR